MKSATVTEHTVIDNEVGSIYSGHNTITVGGGCDRADNDGSDPLIRPTIEPMELSERAEMGRRVALRMSRAGTAMCVCGD